MRRGFALRSGALRNVIDQALEVELACDLEGLKVAGVALVNDVEQGTAPIEETEHAVCFVRDLGDPIDQLGVVDLEYARERWQLLEQPAPLVQAAHALRQQVLRGHLDDDGPFDRAEREGIGALLPEKHAVKRSIVRQVGAASVDDLPLAKRDRALVPRRLEQQMAGLSAALDRLHQVDEAHLIELASDDLRVIRSLELRLVAFVEQDAHAGEDLAQVDGLGEVILDAKLEGHDPLVKLVFRGQENDRDVRGDSAGLQGDDEGEAVLIVRELGVCDDQVRLGELHLIEGIAGARRRRHTIAALAQAHLEHAHALALGIDEQKVLFGHSRGQHSRLGLGHVKPCQAVLRKTGRDQRSISLPMRSRPDSTGMTSSMRSPINSSGRAAAKAEEAPRMRTRCG